MLSALPLLFLVCSCTAPPPPSTAEARLKKIESLYQGYREDFPEVAEITPKELGALEAAEPTVLVDVRTPEEQAVSMLPGAITQQTFEADRERYAGKKVVTYCTIGARSGEYADTLRQEGVDVLNLKGSILAWTQAGLPLIGPGGKETKRVHTYGKKWNLVGEGYEAVYN